MSVKFRRGGVAKSRISADPEELVCDTSNDGGADSWWFERAKRMEQWFVENPLLLGISNESVALVKSQLKRGGIVGIDKTVKHNCWNHIALEMKGVPGVDKALKSFVFFDNSSSKDAKKVPSDETLLSKEYMENVDPVVSTMWKHYQAMKEKLQQSDTRFEKANSELVEMKSKLEELQRKLQNAESTVKTLESEIADLRNKDIVQKTETKRSAGGSGVKAAKMLSSIAGNSNNSLKDRPLSAVNRPPKKPELKKRPSSAGPSTPKASATTSTKDTVVPKKKVDLSKMSMLERQAHFMKIKEEKRARELAKKAEAERLEQEKREQHQKMLRAKSKERWAKVRQNMQKEKKIKNTVVETKKTVVNILKSSTKSNSVSKTTSSKKKTKKSSTGEVKNLQKEKLEKKTEKKEEESKEPKKPEVEEEGNQIETLEIETEASTEENKGSGKENSAPPPLLTPGLTFEFHSIDKESSRARFFVQGSSHIDPSSMYRKRDICTKGRGVSFTVGRNTTTNREEVVSILFDTSLYTEEKAKLWWNGNKSRFPYRKERQMF